MEQGGLSVLIHGDNVDKVRIKTLLENFRIGKQWEPLYPLQ